MSFRILVVLALLVSACASDSTDESTTTSAPAGATTTTVGGPVDSNGNPIPDGPTVPTGPLTNRAEIAVEAVWTDLATRVDPADVLALGTTGDVRLSWLLADLLRFFQGGNVGDAAFDAFANLTGVDTSPGTVARDWGAVTDYLLAWDMPAPPDYVDYKRRLFTIVEEGWQPFFDYEGGDVDWRIVSWGGVLIDDRLFGDPDACIEGCIPAIDDPGVTDAAGGSWYPDDSIVFGVTVNGESRAYPKNIMEVHEMVNDELGGRRIGMPYCTLCGSAQAFFTDVVPDGYDTLVLRTSGLLSRSNKVMYDLDSQSLFDTFLGVAVTGPLHELGYELEPISVLTTTWGEWKTAHPDTTIIAEDGGIGRTYAADPLRGRDDNGPIFPVGPVDQRLDVQDQVVGVVAPDGTVIAFPADLARATLADGGEVEEAGVSLTADGGGLRAFTTDGSEIPAHQAFWFAWSQFRPETIVWQP